MNAEDVSFWLIDSDQAGENILMQWTNRVTSPNRFSCFHSRAIENLVFQSFLQDPKLHK